MCLIAWSQPLLIFRKCFLMPFYEEFIMVASVVDKQAGTGMCTGRGGEGDGDRGREKGKGKNIIHYLY